MGFSSFYSKQVFINLIPKDISGCRILEIGPGYGFYGWVIKALRYGKDDVELWGVEIEPEYYNACLTLGLYDNLICDDANKFIEEYLDHDWKFDFIIMSHVIEHIEKKKGIILINNLKKLCSKRIIITCPEGNTIDKLKLPDKKLHDLHLSMWKEKDFKKLGFKTKHVRRACAAGRVVVLFEKLWFFIKGLRHGGDVIAWFDHNASSSIPRALDAFEPELAPEICACEKASVFEA